MRFFGAVCLVCLLTVTGCGVYSFSAAGKPAFESVNVSPFENRTIEYQMADRLTDAVVDAFINDNNIQVRELSQAEAVLQGEVVSYRRDPYTYDREDIVSEYAVKVSIHVKVLRANSEEIIWEEDFYAEGIYNANTESEEDGQNRAITLLTADILDRTTKNW